MSAHLVVPGEDDEPAANITVLHPHAGITIRTYRVNAETGQREDFTATVVVPPSETPAFTLHDWGPCRCPRCAPQGAPS